MCEVRKKKKIVIKETIRERKGRATRKKENNYVDTSDAVYGEVMAEKLV